MARPSILARTGSKSTNQDRNKRPRHRLQRPVHPTGQLDLVVQRAEDVRDGALFGDSAGDADGFFVQVVAVQPRDGGLVREAGEIERSEEIADEPGVVSLEVLDVQCRVERPEVVRNEKHLPERAVATGDNAGTGCPALGMMVGNPG